MRRSRPTPSNSRCLLDRMGDLMRKDYDWRAQIAKLRMPTLLLFADHDAVRLNISPSSSRCWMAACATQAGKAPE